MIKSEHILLGVAPFLLPVLMLHFQRQALVEHFVTGCLIFTFILMVGGVICCIPERHRKRRK